MQPTLYIVATPIGTLSDLSPRARDVLAEVDFIACEDTRDTLKLLSQFGIRTSLEALHLHNEANRSTELLQRLCSSPSGKAALVSDAGTPCVSDPGALFVREARSMGVRVLSVPGPSSLVAAMAAHGFLQPRTLFSGFLPRVERLQVEEFERWRRVAPAVAVFFESPKRVNSTLKNLEKNFGDELDVCVSREISKKFEEHICGNVSSVLEKLASTEIRGECVISVDVRENYLISEKQHKLPFEFAAQALVNDADRTLTLKEKAKKYAEQNDLSAKELYNRALQLKQEN